MKTPKHTRFGSVRRTPESYTAVIDKGGSPTFTAGPERMTLLFTTHEAVLDSSTYTCSCGFTGDLYDTSSHMLAAKPEAEAAMAVAEAEAKRRDTARLPTRERMAGEREQRLLNRTIARLGRIGRVTVKGRAA